MLRLILAIIISMFVAVGVLAVGLYHFFGWKGLVAFPFLMIVFAWVAVVVIKSLVKNFALRLIGMKARALRGATMNVHSAKLVPKPSESKPEAEGEAKEISAMKAVEIPPKDYVELDVTITPKAKGNNPLWEPAELILTSDKVKSLPGLEEKEIGTAYTVEIWDGSAFGPDDPGKYPGEQRLKIIFEVTPGANSAWVYYYNEPLGQLKCRSGPLMFEFPVRFSQNEALTGPENMV